MFNYLRRICRIAASGVALAGLAGLLGCQTSNPNTSNDAGSTATESPSLLLNEGDVLQIAFPGAPTLNTTQTVRRDGKITVDPAGELQAAGLTPHMLEDEILKKLGSELVDKHVSVTVQASGFVIYVTGAVGHGGKIVADRRLTPLEAVIEAGIDMDKSNLKHVTVIREAADGHTLKFSLNLAGPLHGKRTRPFTLQPLDIIYVPEKFTWY